MTARPRVAPVFDCSGALGRVKTALRRCAVLTRPARSRGLAITGATTVSLDLATRPNLVDKHHASESPCLAITRGSPHMVCKTRSDMEFHRWCAAGIPWEYLFHESDFQHTPPPPSPPPPSSPLCCPGKPASTRMILPPPPPSSHLPSHPPFLPPTVFVPPASLPSLFIPDGISEPPAERLR